MNILKRLAAHLPQPVQHRLKRALYAHQIRRGTFRTGEPEFDLLPELVRSGSVAIDVGANIGHYTLRLAQLVGEHGQVIAFEPMLRTFDLLCRNIAAAHCEGKVNAYQRAASDSTHVVRMSMPKFDTGLDDPYEAAIADDGDTEAWAVPVQDKAPADNVSLIKIDVEGHEYRALLGMRAILEASHPTLIVEGDAPDVRALLTGYGYTSAHLPGSPNTLWKQP